MASTTALTRSSPRAPLVHLALRQARFVQKLIALPNAWFFRFVRDFVRKLVENPHVAELLRFIFLGTIVETSRLAGQKVVDFAKQYFVVKASFTRGDFAFDWVKRYLEDLQVWDHSRVFRVSACNMARRGIAVNKSVSAEGYAEHSDGQPHPVYQPAPREPELFKWKNHWISVNMTLADSGSYNDGVQVLTLSVWSRNRKILDEFVQEARQHYIDSPLPPRELISLPHDSGALLTARFNQGDISYDWMLAFISAQEGYEEITDLTVTTKQAELPQVTYGSADEKPLAAFVPAPRVKQRLRWREHWLQFDVEPSSSNYEGRSYGGQVTVTLHNSKRSVLNDLVEAAHQEYLRNSVSKVTVHIADKYGAWAKCVTKNRRALNTLILPEGIKEKLLDDATEFLSSEEWYQWAGVPHRRGYLLYGEPGTGKSSTIHALASELNLEIYYIQLASQGMDDHNLARLIAETPSRCILLLEDIDCAFPSRDNDDEDDEQHVDEYGQPINQYSDQSTVTLSGLLNVLDSVTSEEGRITFATTNHIERLDPALIRAGRMDVKVEYKLATRNQISQTFNRFFERRFVSTVERVRASEGASSSKPRKEYPVLPKEEITELSEKFANKIPENTFSLAQVQGYLLTKKMDARGAEEHVSHWVQEQLDERQKIKDLKEKKRLNKEKRDQERRERRERERKEREMEDGEANIDANKVNGVNGKASNNVDRHDEDLDVSDQDD